METGDLSVEGIAGNKLYQQRGRIVLPILVRQAKARQTIAYSELAAEVPMPNPRNLNYVLGAVGNSILDLGRTWNARVPPIEALVVNQETGLPGVGVCWFTPDPDVYRGAPQQLRRHIVDAMLSEVYAFRKWDRVLGGLDLQPLPPTSLAVPPVSAVAAGARGGESKAHHELKNAVAFHPEWVGLPRCMAPGEIEVPMYSGDRVDVVFTSGHRRVAVEVKTAGAPPAELVRGMFQCVKYSAVLQAEARVAQSDQEGSALLALGGAMPADLRALRSILGVEVRENVAVGT